MHRLGSTAPAGGWAADQHQSPDLRLGASKAGESIAGNTSLGGKNTQCYCREPCNHVLFCCLAWRAINRACVQCCKPVCVQGCGGLGQLPAWSRGKDGQQMRGAALRQDILVTDCLSAALLWLLSKGSCCTVFTVCFVAFPAL